MDPSLLGQPMPVPTAQKPSGIMTKRTLFIILGVLAVIVIGIFLLVASQDQSKPLMLKMATREKVTLELLQDGAKNIGNDDLKKLNSELIIVLNGHSSNLNAAFKKNEMDEKKKDENPESVKPTLEKLRTAKLNARYDNAYRTALKEQLESLNAMGKELYDKTRSKSLKEALGKQYSDIARYLKQLNTLSV